ncbi:O-acetylhomoserine (thiol)-lyase [Smittium mucronatum]|uniref:O-acetylhomoserine (Thiol)-lyase n=1 Tax=Smittium mucronatum TaxID=133383 RepID=A0A1R0GUR5_9FUNG|nr:O-acetylhomoserine (thiol)-lyase [Smittium mucronatum]
MVAIDENSNYKFETLQVHAGYEVDPISKSRAVPINVTSSFILNDPVEDGLIFELKKEGHLYSRIGNPTVGVLEERVAALEGGVAGVAFSSGTAAIFSTIVNIAKAGDNIVSTSFVYGGTFNMFSVTLPRLGIDVHLVDSDKIEDLETHFDENTKAVFIETIGNPRFNVPDMKKIAESAHRFGIPLIVDNTFGMGGYVCSPIDHGADIVIHSTTKWIGGHGLAIGGMVIDAGSFPWNNGRFPLLSCPSPGYHGLVFWDEFGSNSSRKKNVAFSAKLKSEIVRDVGGCLNAMDAWMFLIGLETLSLRADRHLSNTLALAKWLKNHPKVAWVNYPGLPESESHEIAKSVLKRGFGGVLGFGLKGDKNNGSKFCYNLKMASHLLNVGDAKTLVVHPASSTNRQLSDDQLIASGVGLDLVRVSVGIEHIEDIIADFEQALADFKI